MCMGIVQSGSFVYMTNLVLKTNYRKDILKTKVPAVILKQKQVTNLLIS